MIILGVFPLGPIDLRKWYGGSHCSSWIRTAPNRSHRLALRGMVLFAVLAASSALRAQQPPTNPQPPVEPTGMPGQVVLNRVGQCLEPPPMVQLQDYIGPLHKVIGTFTRKLDRQSVHVPHYRTGMVLCSLEIKDKFYLFLRDSIDPSTFLSAAFNAGISQADNDDAQFGQGGAGYAKRLAANFTDQAQFRFFKEFAYPTIFSEDPRYYRLGQGPVRRRFLHALAHSVVAYNDHSKPMFNFSEWLGEISGISLSNIYHPGNQRGFAPAAEGIASDVAMDIGFDELREFWPEVARKLRLPFRDQNLPTPEAIPAVQ